MKFKGLAILSVACLALGMLSFDASADGPNPGSVLLYPYYNTAGSTQFAVMTITNTSAIPVTVRIVYIDGATCLPVVWQTRTLSGNDTFSFVDSALFTGTGQGFAFVYALDPGTGNEGRFDNLIGHLDVYAVQTVPPPPSPFQAGIISYSMNAMPFRAVPAAAWAPNNDDICDLDGATEYERGPAWNYFPRFYGQQLPFYNSFVIQINLETGTQGRFMILTTQTDCWNDNEEGQTVFNDYPCYSISTLNFVTDNFSPEGNLESMLSNDRTELWNGDWVTTNPHKETGWLAIRGIEATHSISGAVEDDAVMVAFLVDLPFFFIGSADLPFTVNDNPAWDGGTLWDF
jgi:hypothetical protein